MKPLLKNLLGHGAKDKEALEAMRAVLAEIQEERGRIEALVEGASAGMERLRQLSEPLAKTETSVESIAGRMSQMEERFAGLVKMADLFHNLDERAEGLTKSTQWAESRLAGALESSQRIEASMADLASKTELAADLKERLTGFLEVEKPFQLLRRDAESLHGQLEGAVERLARLKDQHDRLLDAHKMATTKLEVVDRRRDELGRSLADKERRLDEIEQAVQDLEGVGDQISEVKRDVGTLKALGDSVAQKTAALETHREALDRALSQTEHLDRAMRSIDAGVRQQKENEKLLAALGDQVTGLRAMHDSVVERSGEIGDLQRQAAEQTRQAREDMAGMTDAMKSTVERFDFETRALESASQRIVDLRSDLSACEQRFKGLHEASAGIGELRHQVEAVSGQMLSIAQEVGEVDRQMAKLQSMRRDLDQTGATAREMSERLTKFESMRPAIESGLKDLAKLAGAHALVKDALDQMETAQGEMTRVRHEQTEARKWFSEVTEHVADLRSRFADVQRLEPAIETARAQAQRLQDAMTAIESHRGWMDDIHKRMTEMGTFGTRIEDRASQLVQRMDLAEQRFQSISDQADAADQVSGTLGGMSLKVTEASVQLDELQRLVVSLTSRCSSLEGIAGETASLQKEIEQRQRSLAEASKELKRASGLREDAANAASRLDELSQKLTSSLETADLRVVEVGELSSRLEDRALTLRGIERRLGEFEARMAKWDVTEQEIARSLEHIAARQATIESLQGDLDRMFTMAEQTSAHVREITSLHQELEEGRGMLQEVLGELQKLKDTKSTLVDRKRQIAQAEERLARADALLVEVRSSVEMIEGQKALVEQAVASTGSLQSLIRQADAAVDDLREAGNTKPRPRGNIIDFPNPGEDGDNVAEAA